MAIENGQSRDTCNVGQTTQQQKWEEIKAAQKTKTMKNTYSPKHPGMNPCARHGWVYILMIGYPVVSSGYCYKLEVGNHCFVNKLGLALSHIVLIGRF